MLCKVLKAYATDSKPPERGAILDKLMVNKVFIFEPTHNGFGHLCISDPELINSLNLLHKSTFSKPYWILFDMNKLEFITFVDLWKEKRAKKHVL